VPAQGPGPRAAGHQADGVPSLFGLEVEKAAANALRTTAEATPEAWLLAAQGGTGLAAGKRQGLEALGSAPASWRGPEERSVATAAKVPGARACVGRARGR